MYMKAYLQHEVELGKTYRNKAFKNEHLKRGLQNHLSSIWIYEAKNA